MDWWAARIEIYQERIIYNAAQFFLPLRQGLLEITYIVAWGVSMEQQDAFRRAPISGSFKLPDCPVYVLEGLLPLDTVLWIERQVSIAVAQTAADIGGLGYFHITALNY